ncbi:YkgJ family cysteine cluster protein [Clostridium sp. chh4-2]|uniref:YkgJ family cysteine cluster protein n=1 Tax=Clostridium sp. chh4-2 TaxID=2067550 RepID=UPI000CCECC6E|nr:YkgJ family cysteine cluster protein [Clostridium sp. chh4-2]PNV62739.1 YkgJ family cysteine cluster protein [Clostridium sp. chh4-2]
MKREVDLQEISDGKLYGLNDMVKADCGDCRGCSACCRGMGNSILLDPLDICRLSVNLNRTFEELLGDKIELNIVDGMILPNLRMSGEAEQCSFLDDNGRCTIHSFRPGICRIFPLGRYYENQGFQYFLQIHECKKDNRTKVKVRKWIDTPDVKRNEQFITDWHYFLNDLQELVKQGLGQEEIKRINLYVLKTFFMLPYKTEEDFYRQFSSRLAEAKRQIFDGE